MPETDLIAHSLLRESQTTEKGIRDSAASWRKRYPKRDGYAVRTYHRKITFDGHEIALVVVAVLQPKAEPEVSEICKPRDGAILEGAFPDPGPPAPAWNPPRCSASLLFEEEDLEGKP